MSTFGLVHGAGLGAWCWERTSQELNALGHGAVSVDLPLDHPSMGAARFAEIVAKIAGGHCPMLSRPRELAEAMAKCVEEPQRLV